MLTEPTDVIDGYKIRPLLIGDGAYPANTWLVKPFPNNLNLSQEQKKFNRFLFSARVTVECAFGILKARWRCLLNCLDHNIKNLSDVIMCCCVLHNISQMKGDSYINQQWWHFIAYFTTRAGEKDSKKGRNVNFMYLPINCGTSWWLRKCWEMFRNKTFASLQSF